MVKIINGEILQDDDPRLQQPRPQADYSQSRPAHVQQFSAGRPWTPPAAQAGRVNIDWSAPPLVLLPSEDGRLPDVGIFGVAVPAVGLIGAATAGLFFGWRGLLGGIIIGYLYLTNRPPTRATGSQPAAAAAAGSNFLQQIQQRLGVGSGDSVQGTASRQQQGASHKQNSSPWAKMGSGHKLGSSG